MNTRERFEKVRQRRNRLSLRTKLTIYVTLEMLVCVGISFGVDVLFNKVFPWKVPLVVELLGVCLLVGVLVTSQLSRYFFNPIKKLRSAMDKVADGDFQVRLEEESKSKEIMEIYTGFNLMAHELYPMCPTNLKRPSVPSKATPRYCRAETIWMKNNRSMWIRSCSIPGGCPLWWEAYFF